MPARWTLCVVMAAFGTLAAEANLAGSEDPKISDTSEEVSVEATPESLTSQQAVQRALEFVAKDAVQWRTEHGCVSCHHGTMTA